MLLLWLRYRILSPLGFYKCQVTSVRMPSKDVSRVMFILITLCFVLSKKVVFFLKEMRQYVANSDTAIKCHSRVHKITASN